MKGTIVLLGILLLLWIGGSSYWYVCRIQGHCNPQQISPEEKIPQEETLGMEKPVHDSTGTENEAHTVVSSAPVIDSLELAARFILENPTWTIYFGYAKYEAEMSPEDQDYMQKLCIYLENEPGKNIYVIGHSDSSGTPEGLVFASDQRAKFIKKVMMGYGIPENQIKLQILGEGFPIASNATSEGRAKNRRVEISLTNFKYNE